MTGQPLTSSLLLAMERLSPLKLGYWQHNWLVSSILQYIIVLICIQEDGAVFNGLETGFSTRLMSHPASVTLLDVDYNLVGGQKFVFAVGNTSWSGHSD
jgi:hypothetical protein